MKTSHVPRALVAFFVSGTLAVASAQTQADLDAQKLRADLAAEQQRESEARAAIAKAAASEATAAASAQAQLGSDQASAAKAKSDYYLSLVPDPSKYKVADPKVPKLAATASRLAYTDASNIAAVIAKDIASHVDAVDGRKTCKTAAATILPDDGVARGMMMQSSVTRKTLDLLGTQLGSAIADLKTQVADSKQAAKGTKAVPFAAALAVGQLAMSIATIAKPLYAFDTTPTQAASDAVLRSKVLETVVATSCFKIVDPSSILYVPDLAKPRPEAAAAEGLAKMVTIARDEVRTALSAAQTLKGAKSASKDTAAADGIETRAKTVTALADDAQKALLALYAADAQGGSPIDTAIRGGLLIDMLAKLPTYTLSVKTVASDMDSAAKDGLFTSLKVSVSSNTVVKWQLVDASGQVATAGALSQGEPLQAVGFFEPAKN